MSSLRWRNAASGRRLLFLVGALSLGLIAASGAAGGSERKPTERFTTFL